MHVCVHVCMPITAINEKKMPRIEREQVGICERVLRNKSEEENDVTAS